MKKINLILIIILILTACVNKNSTYYENLIDEKIIEINKLIDLSSGNTVNDCRIYFVSAPDGCGPFFVYGINGIDTLVLMKKFEELRKIKIEYYSDLEKRGIPYAVCGVMPLDTLMIMNNQCRGCNKNFLDDCKKQH